MVGSGIQPGRCEFQAKFSIYSKKRDLFTFGLPQTAGLLYLPLSRESYICCLATVEKLDTYVLA